MNYAFHDREKLYLVSNFYAGGDLRFHLLQNVKFNERQTSKFYLNKAEFIIASLILAVEYLHHNNLIHRDLKPENIIFDEKGFVYVTDFGVSQLLAAETELIDSSGTPGYMAPEVIANSNHDKTSDYFSLGVIAYELMLSKVNFV